MTKITTILFATLFVLGMEAETFPKTVKLKVLRSDLSDLAGGPFEVSRGNAITEGLVAIILDNPNDDTLLVFNNSKIKSRETRRIDEPQSLAKEFFYTPLAYKFLNTVDGHVFGYLLIMDNWRWLSGYNKKEKIIPSGGL